MGKTKRRLASALARTVVKKRKPNRTGEDRVHKKTKGRGKTTQQQGHRAFALPFSLDDRVLLVGEGNFSFTRSILENSVVDSSRTSATCLDSREELLAKYADAKEIIDQVHELGADVYYGIDGTKLHGAKNIKRHAPFDAIIFNFPHVGSGMKDYDRNILENQKLVVPFFHSALSVLAPSGRIIVSLFQNEKYADWKMKPLAQAEGLRVRQRQPFEYTAFPGYLHKTTIGSQKSWHGRSATMWIFERDVGERHDAPKSNKHNSNDGASDSSS